MNLPDRIDGLSREMKNRIAKECGKAPFIDLNGKKGKNADTEEDLVLLPEGI
jgi:hypothetical protein